MISTRVAGIPFVNVLHSTSTTEYYKAGLQSWPDRAKFALLSWLFTEEQLSKRMSKIVLRKKSLVKSFNTLAKKYGLKEFNNIFEVLEGDYTLLADIAEWVGLSELRPNLHHIGLLPLRLESDIPDQIKEMPRDKPIIYFAMGSSGKPGLIAEIIKGFSHKPYYVVAPVKSHITDMDLEIPSNVIVTDFLPAHKVNPMTDVAVIHGGQNTVMNACLSGTPIVGIGMHPEQQANLDACVRKGFAIGNR